MKIEVMEVMYGGYGGDGGGSQVSVGLSNRISTVYMYKMQCKITFVKLLNMRR